MFWALPIALALPGVIGVALPNVLNEQVVVAPENDTVHIMQDFYWWDDFTKNPLKVIDGAAPMWNLARGGCYPTDAAPNGQQYNGHDQDSCGFAYQPIDKFCPDPGQWKGQKSGGNYFPTYYGMKFCSGDHSWRVAYALYFDHDSGHKSDWEFVIVVFKEVANDFKWWRDSIILEQDGKNVHVNWHDIPDTFTDFTDSMQDGGKDRNHAKIYVTRFHHAMWTTKFDSTWGTCAVDEQMQYRNDDYILWPKINAGLVDGATVPTEWCWGQAASAPGCLMGGSNNCNPQNCGSQDMCWK